ncbi:hypothetical protein AMTRI_Chr09g12820 [Amborella trichopoda]
MEPLEGGSLLLEDFGQKVDLTRRIREVLANYPEGTTVLKELIQNADDAGAKKVCLCLDHRSHGVDSLLSSKLAEWQGPALLAYNDAEFTEDDFVSISRIGGSKKLGQAWKTGRFGVGFNSVYHLTDLPSFVSGKYVVLFDPQGNYLPNVSAANPGKRLNYVTSAAIVHHKDQFSPYCAFGCDMKVPFHGTLFRFPLRNADQASISQLSRQAYLENDIASMFAQLYKESIFTMLFLKNVMSIEFYVWEAREQVPYKLYSCSLDSPNEDTVWHRQALRRLSNLAESKGSHFDSFSLDFLSQVHHGTELGKRIDTFFVVQTLASPSSRIGIFAAAAAKEHDLHLLSWASVAACISDGLKEDDMLKQGSAFCFLPLPVRTSLTVQVNGFFELSSNRRSIWYGDDMDRGGKFRSDWNILLLVDVVAPAFCELLVGVRKILGPTEAYYSLWPSGSFEEPWTTLVKQVYKNISDLPVLHSDIEGGKWVSPTEAFINDAKFVKSNKLGEALMLLGMPVVNLHPPIVSMFSKYFSKFQQRVVSTNTARNFLREIGDLVTLSRDHRLVLLEYCLHNVNDLEVGKHCSGLYLIPLASGDFGLLSEASKGISYFMCKELEYELMGQVPERIIDKNIPSDLLNRLSDIARASMANVRFIDVEVFLQFFPKFVPADWRYKDIVAWDPDSNFGHPTASWFVLFWQYLRGYCDDLSRFSDWPILPSISGHLYRASKTSKLINTQSLSDTMKHILSNIGCKILDPRYGVEHSQLALYVHHANGAGVIDAIFDAFSHNLVQMLPCFQCLEDEEKNTLRQFLLDPKWYIGGHLTEIHIKKCRKLAIYQVYGGESTPSCIFSDLERPRKYLPPLDVPSCFLGEEFVYTSSRNEEEILLRYYGVQRMGKAVFYKDRVLNRIGELQPEVRDTVLLAIVQGLPQLCAEEASFKDTLKKLDFVPTLGGCLKSPQMLYDPRNEELYALLEDSDDFPCGRFREPEVLDMLQGLGLRTLVSPDTVIHSARQIEQIMYTDPQKAYSRSRVLLLFLEVNATKWYTDSISDSHKIINQMFSKVAMAFKSRETLQEADLVKFWNDMRMICWCPVLVKPPYHALPWPSVSSMVAPPKLVRLQSDLWLVSASMRILDGECSSTALSLSLGWSLPPGGSVIAAQLLELGKNNELVIDRVLRQELAVAMPRIYSILSSMIGLDQMDIVKAVLEGCRWIWVGDGFATADEVVLNGPLHLAPYIRVIPVDLAVFKELFLVLGIREALKPMDYAAILSKMAKKKADSPLDSEELRAVFLIVQHMAELQFPDQEMLIFLPDVSSRLFPAKDLVYNDAPWLLDSENGGAQNISKVYLAPRRKVQKFVHGNISNDVVERLGVRSLRGLLLAESADSMNLGLSEAAEAFGQHEALTTRLRHIVEMYADGPGILYELVQNADDARATEVSFLLDKTQYGTSSILSPEMADWQGCALYCYNNSVFSQHDLYAISRIGQDSKLEKPFAIGRFGLGFNCVYHFTDIPCFVSGENIVMFDPHASYLPGISPSHPGLRIKFVGRGILEQFPDQFSPFLHFGCDLKDPFPGTIFRFPLRGEDSALRSQIKREKYTSEDVLSLFSNFSATVAEVLLFLRHVNIVSLYVKDGPGHEMQLFHRVSRNDISDLGKEPHPLNGMLEYILGKQQMMDREQFYKQLSGTVDRNLPSRCRKFVVSERNSLGKVVHFWVVNECIGGGRARVHSLAPGNRSRNFIPWACVATHLHSARDVEPNASETLEELYRHILEQIQMPFSTQDPRAFEGRAFCFLPLPIITGLSTHINAYFELSSNRRDIWFGNDMAGGGKVRSDWNVFLLEDVVAPAYGQLLAGVAEEIGPCDLYFSLWPTTTGPEPWASMVRKLYMNVADLELRVLYTKARGGQWISTKQALFPDYSFPESTELAEALSDAGLPLVVSSEPLVARFKEFCPSLHFLTPHLLRTLLIRRKRGLKNRDAMIFALKYCLSDILEPVQLEKLNGLPLVPLATGEFAAFAENGLGERIFITGQNEYNLLRDSVPYALVDCTIGEEVLIKLQGIAQTGKMNISLLSCHSFVELLPRVLPAEWLHAEQVVWTPGLQGQPSFEWMELFWGYLGLSCDDLSIFSKWPILPIKNGFLLKLVKNSNVIKDDGWSENMSSLLQRLGCYFLRSDLPINHSHIGDYVQNGSASGILNALLAVSGGLDSLEDLFGNALEGELHELRSFICQSKWFNKDQMDSMQIDAIKRLPIFESYKSRKLTCLIKATKWIKPEGVREELMDDSFIHTKSQKEKDILRHYLGVGEPSRIQFYREHVLNRISEFSSLPSVLSSMLEDLKLLIEEDSSFKSDVSQTPFVLTANGSRQCPCRLYDPRIPGLQQLLYKDAFFPCGEFLKCDILEILLSLGMKNTLGFSGLLDSARSVSMLYDSGSKEAMNFGRRLLDCLDAVGFKLADMIEYKTSDDYGSSNFDKKEAGMPSSRARSMLLGELNDVSSEGDLDMQWCINFTHDEPKDDFWLELRDIAWCPVLVDPPIEGLPWAVSEIQVASPGYVRPMSQMWMVSSTMRILDGECSLYIQYKLGWKERPNVRILSTQLVELCKSYNQVVLQSGSCRHIWDKALQREIPNLYATLQEFVDTSDFMVLKSAVNGVPWVWTGDNFVASEALAFDSPVKFQPYLYVVPSELSEYRPLLSALGVKLTFESVDYLHVLERLQLDMKGSPLSPEQLSFVVCLLEALADCYTEKSLPNTCLTSLLIPDSSGVLVCGADVVYNDAPWMEKSSFNTKHFVHSSISNDLANRLGIQSLRYLSLVDEEMTKDLPCMEYSKICDLMALYGQDDLLLFDLLELADCCQARKLHVIFDKREHPRLSLLHPSLGEFQGPALVVVLEGAILSTEEISNLQLLPPWKLRGTTLNYGLGLLSCYQICDLPSIISDGCFYMFDPLGLALSAPSNHVPCAKIYSLNGANLMERFRDQFHPLLIGQDVACSLSGSTIIRLPLSSKCMAEGIESGSRRVKHIFDRFLEPLSTTLLFLKSILQVEVSTWGEGDTHMCQEYGVYLDSLSAIMRNPFSEKKWRKFQISRLFGSSSTATKARVIDVRIIQDGREVIDKWLVVLTLGSGQTRNMALDRRYLAYNLTPVAGVAAHISQNGDPYRIHSSSFILSPLPLSGVIDLPVTVLGYFLVWHNGGRYLFKYQDPVTSSGMQHDIRDQLMAAWNSELMSCVRDSYVEMVLEFQKLRKDPMTSSLESPSSHDVGQILRAYGDQIYSFWPRSKQHSLSPGRSKGASNNSQSSHALEADWQCLIEQVIRPFYVRLVDLPVWQLYGGSIVKAEEGMFLAHPGMGPTDHSPRSTVYSFIKEHYPVFSVPWELVSEIQAVGIVAREIKPKIVRDLLKTSPTSIVLRSFETFVDVFEYCLSDIDLDHPNKFDVSREQSTLDGTEAFLPESGNLRNNTHDLDSLSPGQTQMRRLNMQRAQRAQTQSPGGDPLDMMTNFGKALYDLGRGVVEDISRPGGPSGRGDALFSDVTGVPAIAAEVKGLPCPTATKHLVKLGVTELWIGSKEQQLLMRPLAAKFIDPLCLERPILAGFFSNQIIHGFLKLHIFSPLLLSKHLRLVLDEQWVDYVLNWNKNPWVPWENSSGPQGKGPSPDWIQLFWRILVSGELSYFSNWPLIPAFLHKPILCRVKHSNLVFIPPRMEPTSDESSSYTTAYEMTNKRYPWLLSFLNECNLPVYDVSFLEYNPPQSCLPRQGQTLGQAIISKLLAAKQAGYPSEPASLSDEVCDELFTLFASDFDSSSPEVYIREELDMLRELPIFKTVVGKYTRIYGQNQCIISPNAFFQPYDEQCFSHSTVMGGSLFFHALGIPELHNQEILVRFALNRFEEKTEHDQDLILMYLIMNWDTLQSDSTVIAALKETKFVRSADESCAQLYKPKDLLDPSDSLLKSVFSGERIKFPGERFTSEAWLRLLRKTSLRTSSEADTILDCARKVEMMGSEAWKSTEDPDAFDVGFLNSQSELPSELWSLAGSVVEAILGNFAVLYGSHFCDVLSKIVFVPAEKGLPEIEGKKGGKRVLASYNEAILLKDWPLAWSCAPILARPKIIPPEFSWGALHLRTPPVFSTVLRHLQIVGRNGGEDTLARWPTSSSMISIEDASYEVLKYLEKLWHSLSAKDISELRKVAFIPLANGTRLVTAYSLFARLTINLSPFAFELPAQYLPFMKILKDIGLQDHFSLSCAKDLLLKIQQSCGYQRLNPNELRAVMEILHFISEGTASSGSEGSISISDVIVPDDGCRLVLARTCIYVDAYGSRFINDIETSRLRFVHPDLPEKICALLGVKKLSEMVVEELDEKQPIQALDHIGPVTLTSINDKILSQSFQVALWTILRNLSDYVLMFRDLTLEKVQSLLKTMAEKLQFSCSIYTRFLLLPRNLDITRVTKESVISGWEKELGHRTLHFVDRSKTHVLVAEPPEFIPLTDVLAIVVSQIMDSPLTLPIGSLFSAPENSEKALLGILKLGSGKEEIGTYNIVGKELIPQDSLQVHFHPLRPFYAGEIVAWKPDKDGEKLRYGRVPENVRPSAGQALYRFLVETAPGETSYLLSSRVYSFKSMLTDSEGRSSSVVQETVQIGHSGTERGKQVRLVKDDGGGKTGKKPAQQKDLQYGKVSTTELVQAVQDILSAAGLSMDVENQTLLQTTLLFQEQLKESQAALLLEQERADTAAKEAEAAKSAWSCRVCLGVEIDTMFVPCGHVLCHRCCSAVSRCPFCRIHVKKTHKIFRP